MLRTIYGRHTFTAHRLYSYVCEFLSQCLVPVAPLAADILYSRCLPGTRQTKGRYLYSPAHGPALVATVIFHRGLMGLTSSSNC